MAENVILENNAAQETELRVVIADTLGMDVSELPEIVSMETISEWTSLQHLSIMAAVEESFGIEMSMEEMTEAQSLPALSKIINQHKFV